MGRERAYQRILLPLAQFQAKQLVCSEQNAALDRISSAEGDHARFNRLLMPHLGGAYSLARWITGNGADAEDVVQEAKSARISRCQPCCGRQRASMAADYRAQHRYSWLRKNRPTAVITVEDLEAVECEHAKQATRTGETPEAALIAKADAEQPARQSLLCRAIPGDAGTAGH